MKTLNAQRWRVDCYDEKRKGWFFQSLDEHKDWEFCLVPEAKMFDRKRQTITTFTNSGEKIVTPMTVIY